MEFYIIQALLGALLFGLGGILFKWNIHNSGDEVFFFFGLYTIGALFFFIDGFDEIGALDHIQFYVMAAFIGLGSAGGNYAFSRGLNHGPAGLTSAFAKANIVVVILISSFYYGEALTLLEFLGILSFLMAMLVVNVRFGKGSKAVSSLWFVIMLICILLISFRNGGLKIAEEAGMPSTPIMILAYGYCALFYFLAMIHKRKKIWVGKATRLKVVIVGGFTGIVSYAGLYFYIKALETGPGSVVVTIFSLDMFFLLLASYLFFGERLNFKQKIGFALSALGFVLIALN